MLRHVKRHLRWPLAICMFLYLTFDIYLHLTFRHLPSNFHVSQNPEFNEDREYEQLSCKFARLDPFDPQIQKYIRHPRTIACARVQEYDMTFIDDEGVLRMNVSEWQRATGGNKTGHIVCACRTFDRPLGATDNDHSRLEYGPTEYLQPDYPLRLPGDTIEVWCTDIKIEKRIYWNVHAHPSSAGKRMFQNVDKAPDDQLSVIMMVIDSISLSAFKRHLPSTYNYLTQEMGFFVFNGYNKVADNTRPNTFPMLTGKRLQNEQADMPPEFNEIEGFLDGAPELIWKQFARLNYSTVMNEDFPSYGLFHYGSKGFVYKPADYYYHALWMGINALSDKLGSSEYCFGNIPKVQFQIDLTRRHLEVWRHKLQFVFSFFAELSHNEDSAVERADDLFLSFFQRMNEGNVFNRSVVMFMADHGHRFSRTRETLVGVMEERQPMFSVRFPPWFYKKYPHLEKNLRLNTMRLTSPFDIHETLKDILHLNFNGEQRKWDTRGLSMIYPIPRNRTCTLAGIPDHFCTCQSQESFNTSNKIAVAAGQFLTRYLNTLISNSSGWSTAGTECHQWIYKNVTRAERVGVSTKVKVWQVVKEINTRRLKSIEKIASNYLGTGEKLRVAVRMEPKEALFEAEMVLNGDRSDWMVLGQVMRLDAYGNQSWCVNHEIIRKYCVCKDIQN